MPKSIPYQGNPISTNPWWWNEAPPPELDQVQIPEKTDVVIVGAGFTGLNAALVLARAGREVLLLEADEMGRGASTRNGGMVGPSLHKLGIAGLKAKYGEEVAYAIIKESLKFVDYFSDFIKRENIECDFARTGRFRGALKPQHYDNMARDLEHLNKVAGVKGHVVSRSEQHAEIGSGYFHGGVVYDYDGGIHPAKYFASLVERAIEAGVIIAAQTPALNISEKNNGLQVTTNRGTTQARDVLITTNGYTGNVTPGFRRRIVPLRSAMIATEELPAETIDRLMPKRRMIGDSGRIVTYYRPSPDGKRILFGGRAASLKDTPQANARDLHGFLSDVFPELESARLTNVWSGLVAYTFDHSPHIGKMPHLGKKDSLHYAMGYCGSGVARTSFFGHKIALKILGEDDSQTPFDDLPFNTRPLYTGNPWFMPAILNWHRIADKMGW